MSPFVTVIRWVLVLPGAFLAVLAVWWLNLATAAWWVGGTSPWWWAFFTIVIHYMLGTVFCYAGARIAPSHQAAVAVALAVINLVVVGLGIAGWIGSPGTSWSTLVAVLAYGAGSVAFAYRAIREGDEAFEQPV